MHSCNLKLLIIGLENQPVECYIGISQFMHTKKCCYKQWIKIITQMKITANLGELGMIKSGQ